MCVAARFIEASARHAVSHGLAERPAPESAAAVALAWSSPSFAAWSEGLAGDGGGEPCATVVVAEGACCICPGGGCANWPCASRLSWPRAPNTFCSAAMNCASASPKFWGGSSCGIAVDVTFDSPNPAALGDEAAPQPAAPNNVAVTSTKAAEPKRRAGEEGRFIEVSTLDVRPGAFGSRGRWSPVKRRSSAHLTRPRKKHAANVNCDLFGGWVTLGAHVPAFRL